jgi:hypothetical protein
LNLTQGNLHGLRVAKATSLHIGLYLSEVSLFTQRRQFGPIDAM